LKFAEQLSYADPEVAMKKLLAIANSVEAIQDGRIHIEKINGSVSLAAVDRREVVVLNFDLFWTLCLWE
jgi:hypothetical protein